jgi:DNA polymerase epsilon subunit 3
LYQAASIYILYLTTTANDICKSKKRSTVTANDVLEAISEIQFEEMLPQLNEFLAGARQKADDVKSQKKRKADDTGAADDSKVARVEDAADAQEEEQAVDEEPVEQEDAEPEAEEV